MVFGLFRKNRANRAIVERQYGLLTTAARDPDFFREADVPDTVMGRYEMLSVVLILYFRRVSVLGERAKAVAQDIVDAFFEDLDHSIRELGIGDQGVPKRMKKLASMFYGRLDSYTKALDQDDVSALSAALLRNIHPENSNSALSMTRLAQYMQAEDRRLQSIPEDAIERGEARLWGLNEVTAHDRTA